MKNSKIEWCDHTFNPWEGCTRVSPGCANCYAEARNQRFAGGANWGPGAPRRRTSAANWRQPLKWNEEQQTRYLERNAGEPIPDRPRVFCASLADWLDDEVPIVWLADLLDLIRRTPNLDWLLLTKRPQNGNKRLTGVIGNPLSRANKATFDYVGAWLSGTAPSNVWIGTTAEDQARADERIPHLLSIPARVRFLSCEPLLGPVDLDLFMRHGRDICDEGYSVLDGVHWVICGGESGPKARPMHPDWARSLRDQCAAAGVPFHFKQWGEWLPDNQRNFRTSGAITWGLLHQSGQFRSCLLSGNRVPDSDVGWKDGEEGLTKVGKIAAGRLLDGREHNEFPTP